MLDTTSYRIFIKDPNQKHGNKTEYIKRWKRENENSQRARRDVEEGKQRGKTTDSFKFMSVMLK